jgi:hypothetical protein
MESAGMAKDDTPSVSSDEARMASIAGSHCPLLQGGGSREQLSLSQRAGAFRAAFWKFLRPHTIRGTILGASAVTARALLENQHVSVAEVVFSSSPEPWACRHGWRRVAMPPTQGCAAGRRMLIEAEQQVHSLEHCLLTAVAALQCIRA